MKRLRTKARPVNIGTSLLIVIFLVLCLFTFAAISLHSAMSDRTHALRNQETMTAYYAACNKAEARLAELSKAAKENGKKADSSVSFTEKIDDARSLQVKLSLDKKSGQIKVTKWQTVTDGDWNSDSTVNVFSPFISGGN